MSGRQREILIDPFKRYMLQIQQTNLLLKCADFYFPQLLSGSIQFLFAFFVEKELTRQQYYYVCFDSFYDFYERKKRNETIRLI